MGPGTTTAFSLLLLLLLSAGEGAYHGKSLGKLKTLHHGVSGEVFAVDARTLHIRDFSYDGEGPAAYFYVGNSKAPSQGGLRLNDEKGSNGPLPRYRKKHVTISLPESTTLNNIKWFSVWCDDFSVNFGDVKIPKNLDYPKPQKIDALNGVHAVSSENIVVVDAQTLLIPSFSYDGEAPDAKFWVGRGPKPSSQGVRVADENGKEDPLRRYDRKTIVLTLPGDLTVFDIGHFGVWCEAFAVDFGHIRVPGRSLNVPPSLHMLGVSPQNRELIPSTLEQSLYQQLLFNQQQQQQQQLQQQQQQQSHHRFAVDVPFVTAADSSGNFNEQIDPSSFPEGDQSSLAAFPPSNQRTLSSPQQRVHVTTFRPTQLSTRGGKARDFKGATSVQIVPSIALSPDNSFLGRADVPQGSFQGFLANNPVPQNYFTVVESDSPAQGQASIQEVLRVRPERVQGGGGAQVLRAHPDHNHGGHSGAAGAARRHDGRSFSHLSINGAGGSSDTFVQYK